MMGVAAILLFCAAQDPTAFEERRLGRIPDGAAPSCFSFAPDGREAAFVANVGGINALGSIAGGRWFVARGGDLNVGFDAVGPYVWTPDGKAVAYAARDGDENFMVIEGADRIDLVEIGDGGFNLEPPVFNVDGGAFAYRARTGERCFVVVQERGGAKRIGEAFADVGPPVFHPDGKTVAYAARKDRRDPRAFVTAGDARGPEFEEIDHVTYGADGRLAYRAKEGGVHFIMVDGSPQASFDLVGAPRFSPDGRTLAYAAKGKESWGIVVNGEAGERFNGVEPPILAASGAVVHAAESGGKWLVVADGKKGEKFDQVGTISVSADGRVVAYPVRRKGRMSIVVGDRDQGDYEDVRTPALSADGSVCAFAATEKREAFVVVNGRKGEAFDETGAPVVSADGRIVAYSARKGRELIVVAGDKRSESFDWVTAPRVSADGSKVAFGARKGRELWWKVVSPD